MSALTKVNICFSLPVPTILIRIAVWILLLYRRLRYGYPFRRIKLTRGKYAKVDQDDFERLNRYNWQAVGSKGTYYAKRTAFRNAKPFDQYMHRVVCPAPPGMVVDHINRDALDNRKLNLRPATQKQNTWNRDHGKKNATSTYKGVFWDKRRAKWQARLHYNGRSLYLGLFADEIEAAKAYDRVAKKYRGEYAFLNFPEK
jgi:hypothetical protein